MGAFLKMRRWIASSRICGGLRRCELCLPLRRWIHPVRTPRENAKCIPATSLGGMAFGFFAPSFLAFIVTPEECY
jgi:hypothetical protein